MATPTIILTMLGVILLLVLFGEKAHTLFPERHQGKAIILKAFLWFISGWLSVATINVIVKITEVGSYAFANTVNVFYKTILVVMYILTAAAFFGLVFGFLHWLGLKDYGTEIQKRKSV